MSKEEHIQLEYTTLMEQYKAARDEINGLLEASRQMVGLTFTVISLFLGVSAFVETKMPIAYLILPFFLYGLTWVQLRHILLMRRASEYIATTVAPRVRDLLKALSPNSSLDTSHILDWEERWQSPGMRKGGLWLLPVLGAGYGLPLFAAVLSLGAYFLLVPIVPFLDWVLIVANLVGLVYSVILGFLIEFRRFG
ncbi:MAG: hypothetical protein JXB07_02585 [Anaerolineae bacterium]|nr:hypothetical protein [Anaerolineae bacterium]